VVGVLMVTGPLHVVFKFVLVLVQSHNIRVVVVLSALL